MGHERHYPMNDLLEQLVGDLDDDHSAPRELHSDRADRFTNLADPGIAQLDEVAEHLGVELPTGSMTPSAALSLAC